MPITALPTPPTRTDVANFSSRADAFLSALPAFATQANELAADVTAKQSAAAISASAASASEVAATQAAGVTAWVSGTTYSIGQVRYDTTNFLTYRRRTAGAGTTRPGLDSTNWQLLTGLGDVSTSGNQTIAGIKSFSDSGGITAIKPVMVRQDTTSNGGRIDLQRAGDGTVHYYLDVAGSGITPVFRLYNSVRSSPSVTVDHSGNLTAEANITAYSDIRLKTDLVQISGALDKVKQLTGYVYTRLDTGERQTGLIAQDVQKVLPEAVLEGEVLSLAYGNLIGLLVEAIKDLEKRVKELEVK